MNYDKITHVNYAHEHAMGPMRVRQPLPEHNLENVGPFVLLHHAAPKYYQPNTEPDRLGPHPHRGFEPVTFLYEGGLFHRDSMGNEGYLTPGGVQWMTSGSGILHSEGPSPDFLKQGGTLELIQLWVNVPAKNKMVTPKYQDLKAERFPLISDEEGVDLKLVAGHYNQKTGPASTYTPINAIMGDVVKGKELTFQFPKHHKTLVYVLRGNVEFNKERLVERYNMVAFENTTGTIHLSIKEDARLLILNAEPINEPVVAYGPFVMNTMDEIKQAYSDVREGKFGQLSY